MPPQIRKATRGMRTNIPVTPVTTIAPRFPASQSSPDAVPSASPARRSTSSKRMGRFGRRTSPIAVRPTTAVSTDGVIASSRQLTTATSSPVTIVGPSRRRRAAAAGTTPEATTPANIMSTSMTLARPAGIPAGSNRAWANVATASKAPNERKARRQIRRTNRSPSAARKPVRGALGRGVRAPTGCRKATSMAAAETAATPALRPIRTPRSPTSGSTAPRM